MRCKYCESTVLKDNSLVIPGVGLVHGHCHEVYNAISDVFYEIDERNWLNDGLVEIKTKVLPKDNERRGDLLQEVQLCSD